MGILDKVISSFGSKDKAAAQPSTEQEAEQLTAEQEKIRDAGAASNEELCMALERCKASLGKVENLDPTTIRNISDRLDECEHLIQGMHAQVDISQLDKLLLKVIESSLLLFFLYGQRNDIRTQQPVWEGALNQLKECISARSYKEPEVDGAIVNLRILRLQASNLSQNNAIREQQEEIELYKEDYRRICAENGITDISNATDLDVKGDLQFIINSIEQMETTIRAIKDIIGPNGSKITELKQWLKLQKIQNNTLLSDEDEAIDRTIQKGDDALLQIHNEAMKLKQAREERLKHRSAMRDLMDHERHNLDPVLSKEELSMSEKILNPDKQEDTVTAQATQQAYEEPLTE